MPEGAEVRRCCNVIKEVINNKRVLSLKPVSGKLLNKGIKGYSGEDLGTVTDVRVKGKVIAIETSSGRHVVSTLGMSGWWYPGTGQLTPEQAEAKAHYNNKEVNTGEIIESATKFTRAQFICSDGTILNYSDMRNFGNMYVTDSSGVEAKFATLGPDLLNGERNPDVWMSTWRTLKNGKRIIGEALLEQSLFCGLGNIYRAEACFLAGVDPFTKVSDISDKHLNILYDASRYSLLVGYNSGSCKNPRETGYSFKVLQDLVPTERFNLLKSDILQRMNVNWDDVLEKGYYSGLMVYGRSKCPTGEIVKRDVLGGRTIWYV